MKEQETIELLKHWNHFYEDKKNIVNAHLIAIEALEKQIPKKPIGEPIPYCPHCNKVFVTSNDDYCHRCGGKIDWSVSE